MMKERGKEGRRAANGKEGNNEGTKEGRPARKEGKKVWWKEKEIRQTKGK